MFSDTAFNELKPEGIILLNTKKYFDSNRIFTIDANTIAEEILKRPITNTIMLGAFAAISGKISFDNISEAIRQYMPEKLHEKNIGAVEAAITAAKGALV